MPASDGRGWSWRRDLREAIKDPDQVPGEELWQHVEYEDGSTEAFLRHLWRDLDGDEPIDAPGHA
jgi:hypothetical protein